MSGKRAVPLFIINLILLKKMKWYLLWCVPCLLVLSPWESRAALNKVPETDRIGLGESAAILQTRIWRTEAGFNYSWTGGSLNNQNSISFPFILFRTGIWENFEIRGSTEYLMLPPAEGAPKQDLIHCLNYSSVGVKIRLSEDKGLLPETSVLAMFGFGPSGSRRLMLPDYHLSMRLLCEKGLGRKTSFSLNVGVYGNERKGSWQADETLTFSYQLTKEIETYAETFGSWGGGSLGGGANTGIFIRWKYIKFEMTSGVIANDYGFLLFSNGGVAFEAF